LKKAEFEAEAPASSATTFVKTSVVKECYGGQEGEGRIPPYCLSADLADDCGQEMC